MTHAAEESQCLRALSAFDVDNLAAVEYRKKEIAKAEKMAAKKGK